MVKSIPWRKIYLIVYFSLVMFPCAYHFFMHTFQCLTNSEITSHKLKRPFGIEDRGNGDVSGLRLLDKLRTLKDPRIMILINGRWFSTFEKGVIFYIYNCHPTHSDGEIDFFNQEPAVIFKADSAEQAFNIWLKLG